MIFVEKLLILSNYAVNYRCHDDDADDEDLSTDQVGSIVDLWTFSC